MSKDVERAWRVVSALGRSAWTVYQGLETVKAHRRADEQHRRTLSSLKDATRVRRFIEDPRTSEALGAGRLGNLDDAKREGMLDNDGLFLGALEGQPLFYNGDMHLLNYGMTRSGKGRDIVLPNLAHVFNRSIVVNDIKDGENAYASLDYRKARGHKIVVLDPYGKLDEPTFKLNPFQRIIDKAQRGESVTEDALQICMSLVPPKKEKDGWVAAGAQQILSIWLEWAARYRPDRCTLSEMWRFVFKDFVETIETILDCGDDALSGLAVKLVGIKESTDQWNAYESELTTALWNFRPDTPLAVVTDTSNFDPAEMRHEKTTLYLIGDSDRMEACASWLSLSVSAIVNACAQEPGPVRVTVLIDELANLPYMAVIPKALTLYAGKGVQLWGFCQGRAALRSKGYSDYTIANFESQSGVLHMWLVTEPDLVRDIETWSGKKAVATRGVNQSGGQVASASFGITEHARPVLQSEDIMAIGEGEQIIRTGKHGGTRLYVADRVPWFEVPRWKSALKDVSEVHFGKP